MTNERKLNSPKPLSISKETLIYAAAFIDADGCLNAQLVAKSDYRLLYQIRLTLMISQSTSRLWFLQCLKKKFGNLGSIRQKPNENVSEYTIVGPQCIQLLEALSPYLILKRKNARLLIALSKRVKRGQDIKDFLECCKIVDQFGNLNASKKRTNTTSVVEAALKLKFGENFGSDKLVSKLEIPTDLVEEAFIENIEIES